MPQIRDLWARELFESYYRQMLTGVTNGVISGSLRRDVAFFSALSIRFNCKSEVTGLLIVHRFGHEMVRRHERAISFLNGQGVISTYDDPDYELEFHLSRIRDFIDDQSPWAAIVLRRFLAHIIKVRDKLDLSKRHRAPTRPKSVESAVRSAAALLSLAESSGAKAINELSQDSLERLIGSNQRFRLTCASFVRYLNKHEKLFEKLRIPSRQNSVDLRRTLSEEKRTDLIEHFGQATDRADLHWALVALLVLIYAQSPTRAVRMLRNQVRERKGGGHQICFTKIWIDLDDVTSGVLTRWLDIERREWSSFERSGTSRYLFPGKKSGSHASSISFLSWLRKNGRGVGVRALMTTSLTGWVSSSLNTYAVIIEALGISRATTSKYSEALGVQQAKMAKNVISQARNRLR